MIDTLKTYHVLADDLLTQYSEAEYLNILKCYLDDSNFLLLKDYILEEDYALAIDACKGLYILALELRAMGLYTSLIELYECLLDKDYQDSLKYYQAMLEVYNGMKGLLL